MIHFCECAFRIAAGENGPEVNCPLFASQGDERNYDIQGSRGNPRRCSNINPTVTRTLREQHFAKQDFPPATPDQITEASIIDEKILSILVDEPFASVR
jgi:hypothetical protein